VRPVHPAASARRPSGGVASSATWHGAFSFIGPAMILLGLLFIKVSSATLEQEIDVGSQDEG
jgi:hypothetical protein